MGSIGPADERTVVGERGDVVTVSLCAFDVPPSFTVTVDDVTGERAFCRLSAAQFGQLREALRELGQEADARRRGAGRGVATSLRTWL